MHLELLYVPYGMDNGFVNPFTPNFSMTSLEKVLKSGANGIDATESEKEAAQKKKEVIIRGVLSVTVISAEDLPPVDLMGKADPYVVLTLKKSETRNKTRVGFELPYLIGLQKCPCILDPIKLVHVSVSLKFVVLSGRQ